jgi:hypothetical protein
VAAVTCRDTPFDQAGARHAADHPAGDRPVHSEGRRHGEDVHDRRVAAFPTRGVQGGGDGVDDQDPLVADCTSGARLP